MAVIRTFFNSDTREIMEEQESEGITTTQVTNGYPRFLAMLNKKGFHKPPFVEFLLLLLLDQKLQLTILQFNR